MGSDFGRRPQQYRNWQPLDLELDGYSLPVPEMEMAVTEMLPQYEFGLKYTLPIQILLKYPKSQAVGQYYLAFSPLIFLKQFLQLAAHEQISHPVLNKLCQGLKFIMQLQKRDCILDLTMLSVVECARNNSSPSASLSVLQKRVHCSSAAYQQSILVNNSSYQEKDCSYYENKDHQVELHSSTNHI